jgi:hypothetical protein
MMQHQTEDLFTVGPHLLSRARKVVALFKGARDNLAVLSAVAELEEALDAFDRLFSKPDEQPGGCK